MNQNDTNNANNTNNVNEEKVIEFNAPETTAHTEEMIEPDPVCFEEALSESVTPKQTDESAWTPSEEGNGAEWMGDDFMAKRNKHGKQKKRQMGRIVLLVIFLLILIGILSVVGIIALYRPTVDTVPSFSFETDEAESTEAKPSDTDSDTDKPGDETAQAVTEAVYESVPTVKNNEYARRDGVYNFLILGIDKVANLSDVIMLVSFDTKEHTVGVVSLPRDTYIDTGSNYHKVNAYFSASYNHASGTAENRYRTAVESMVTFLEKGLCVQIDRYICMDTAGFREIVDAIGGVDLEVPFDMDYEDPEQELYIHLKAGAQHLNGGDAESFVRFRKAYLNGDLGRISAQKLFLNAFANQVRNNLTVSSAISVAKACLDYVMTDITASEIAFFVKNSLACSTQDITYATFSGGEAVNPNSGASYFVLYAESACNLVNRMLNVYTKEISLSVFLSNSKKFTSSVDYISNVFLSSIGTVDSITAEEVDANGVKLPHK